MKPTALASLRGVNPARHAWPAVLALIAAISILTMIALAREAGTSLQTLSRNPIDADSWVAVQTQTEHERFQALARLARTDSAEVSRAEFAESFATLVARHAALSQGRARQALGRLPEFETVLGEMALVMTAVGEQIETIDRRPLAETAAAIYRLLVPLDRPLKRVAAEALQATSAVASQHRVNLGTLLNLVTAMFLLFCVAVAAVGIAMVRQTRRVVESENQMRDALEKLNEANTAKSRFLASISHELRTPLNAIMGFSEVMKLQLFGPLSGRYAEYARDIHRSAEHLLALITDVLDMARIEAGGLTIKARHIDLTETCGGAVLFLRDRAASKSVMLTYSPGPEIELFADPRALRQVVTNLLGNAIKFTPPGGEVQLSWTLAGDGSVRLSIADTGIGIPATDIDRVTEPFHRAANALDTTEGGTGLGLAITRSLVELHGGRLTLDSHVGEGTIATVVLPAARVASMPPGAHPVPSRNEQIVGRAA